MNQGQYDQQRPGYFQVDIHLQTPIGQNKLRTAPEYGHKGRELNFFKTGKAGAHKCVLPGCTRKKMGESYGKRQKVWNIPEVFDHDHPAARLADPTALFQERHPLHVRSDFMYGRKQKYKVCTYSLQRNRMGRHLSGIRIYRAHFACAFDGGLGMLFRIVKIKHLQIGAWEILPDDKAGFIKAGVNVDN